MSRLVGPKGQVCAFEANRHTLKQTIRTLEDYGCGNIWISHNAVYDRSGILLPLYQCDHGGDSVVFERAGEVIDMPRTLSLDDFCTTFDLWPQVVKMDIEGAEIMALRGAEKMLGRRPALVLEQDSNNSSCIDLLRPLGYRFFDLNSYREIKQVTDFPDRHGGALIRNLLCLHESNCAETPYGKGLAQVSLALIGAAILTRGRDEIRAPAQALGPGRYVVDIRYAWSSDVVVTVDIGTDKNVITTLTGPLSVLAKHYADLPFHLYEASPVNLTFRAPGAVKNFSVEAIDLKKIEGFDGLARPLSL